MKPLLCVRRDAGRISHSLSTPIRIPEHLITDFLDEAEAVSDTVTITQPQLPWSGIPPIIIVFQSKFFPSACQIMLQVGRCKASHQPSRNHSEDSTLSTIRKIEWSPSSLWANVSLRHRASEPDDGQVSDKPHNCPEDHILTWTDLKKTFTLESPGYYPRHFILTFMGKPRRGSLGPQDCFTLSEISVKTSYYLTPLSASGSIGGRGIHDAQTPPLNPEPSDSASTVDID